MSAVIQDYWTGTGSLSVVINYSSYFERIATALESLAKSQATIASISTSTGIRMVSPYDWIKPTEIYSWYNQDQTSLIQSTSTLETLVSNINTITNYMPKFI